MWKAKGKKKKKKFGLVKGAGVFGAAAAAEPAAEASADAKGGGNTVADVNARLARGGFTSNRAKRQALELQKAALTEDASVFDYDGVYDSMTSARDSAAAAQASERKERKSKYTENLLKQAQMRKLQSDRIYERKLRREAAEVAEMHGGVKDEDKFVGAAYRKQLEEREAWEKAEREEAEREVNPKPKPKHNPKRAQRRDEDGNDGFLLEPINQEHRHGRRRKKRAVLVHRGLQAEQKNDGRRILRLRLRLGFRFRRGGGEGGHQAGRRGRSSAGLPRRQGGHRGAPRIGATTPDQKDGIGGRHCACEKGQAQGGG